MPIVSASSFYVFDPTQLHRDEPEIVYTAVNISLGVGDCYSIDLNHDCRGPLHTAAAKTKTNRQLNRGRASAISSELLTL